MFSQYISYPGPSPDLEALLPKDKLNQFPTYSENKKVQWLTNGDWWFEKGGRDREALERVQARAVGDWQPSTEAR